MPTRRHLSALGLAVLAACGASAAPTPVDAGPAAPSSTPAPPAAPAPATAPTPAPTSTPAPAPAATTPQRPLSELVATTDLGIDKVRDLAAHAHNKVEILPPNPARRDATLLALQVTTRSPIGAVAYDTGGILVDDGFVRIFGSGAPRVPENVATWSGYEPAGAKQRIPNALIVGVDALGSFFAMNGGAWSGPKAEIYYLAPESLVWEDLGYTYGTWLATMFNGDLEKFYEGFRWKSWRADVLALAPGNAFTFFPPLWSKEGSAEVSTRGPAPLEELWTAALQARATFGIR